jgi:GT2 family glycosyltransferase
MSQKLDDVVVVLVHHRNYALIGETTQSILDQGIPPERVLIVDNSEEVEKRNDLLSSVHPEARVIFVSNRGYGAAVNAGVSHWEALAQPSYVLIATHEVVPWSDAVYKLRDALDSNRDADAAGPTLVSGESSLYVWSAGGRLSRGLGLPRHFDHRQAFDPASLSGRSVERRMWLDGAFVLYRWAALVNNPLDETYFMYMEETDLHLRLNSAGRSTLWVPSATVWQSSDGIPPYYLSRNLRLLYRRTGRKALGMLAVPIDAGRRALSDARNRKLGRATWDLVRGLFARLPPPPPRRSGVVIINPLGAALRHYTSELQNVLEAAGGLVLLTTSFPEPSATGRGRIAWLRAYVSALVEIRRSPSLRGARLIVTWPILGYLDALVLRLFYGSGATLVMHDPEPLVRAVGYDRVSVHLARLFQKHLEVVVHSHAAEASVKSRGAYATLSLNPHPILPARQSPHVLPSGGTLTPIIRVLGQYKADRDIPVLRAIAHSLGGGARLEIYGRGWPAVEGWVVTEGFLSEEDMAARIRDSSVIVVPYIRFFQSGVAIRALENGVAVVGPKVPSLVELFGENSKLLVATSETEPAEVGRWVDALEWAIAHGGSEVLSASENARAHAISAWSIWLANGGESVR